MREATREAGVVLQQQPWVTYALLLVLLAAFAWARVEDRQIAAELSTALADAEAYLADHPYLKAPPLLETKLGAEQVQIQRDHYLAAQRARSAPPIPAPRNTARYAFMSSLR